jgi:hypothetical protein
MCSSFFGSQEGDFSLKVKSITALEKTPESKDLSTPIVYDPQRLEAGTLPSRRNGFTYNTMVIAVIIVGAIVLLYRLA